MGDALDILFSGLLLLRYWEEVGTWRECLKCMYAFHKKEKTSYLVK